MVFDITMADLLEYKDRVDAAKTEVQQLHDSNVISTSTLY